MDNVCRYNSAQMDAAEPRGYVSDHPNRHK